MFEPPTKGPTTSGTEHDSKHWIKFICRTFVLTLPDESKREVKQMQTEQWPDLSVPDNPRLLLDLVHRAKALHKGPGTRLSKNL